MSVPAVLETPPATSQVEVDAKVQALARRRRAWAATGLRERADFLDACLAGVRQIAPEWARRVCLAKGIDPASELAGEAWLSGPMTTLRCLRVTADALRHRAAPRLPGVRERGAQQIVTVAPAGAIEKALLAGIGAEVWLQPGAAPTQGALYRAKELGDPGEGGVALVLGAGNVSSIAPLDIVHKLIADDEVVVLKMHPVKEYLGPLFERAFTPLFDAGYLAIVYGGAEEGRYLCRHDLVDSIHLTGSHHTHDAIVWGDTEEERQRRKAAGDPLIDKRVTSELGCVTPVMVTPGEWSPSELEFQAESVAGMVTHNASFNCTAAKAIVFDKGWAQAEEFLERLCAALAATPARRAYYPGARQRYERFLAAYPNADAIGPEAGDGVPWTIIPGVAPTGDEMALREEAFCGVLAIVGVDADGDPSAFLREAVTVANEEIWGNLSCCLIVDPRTERQLEGEVDDAVAALRYGGVAVNTWSSVLFGLSTPTWGAFPGNPLDDVQSGIGTVGNAMLLDHPQKSVARAPFKQWPRPPWIASHRTLDRLARAWTDLEAAPAWRRLPRVAWAAIRG